MKKRSTAEKTKQAISGDPGPAAEPPPPKYEVERPTKVVLGQIGPVCRGWLSLACGAFSPLPCSHSNQPKGEAFGRSYLARRA